MSPTTVRWGGIMVFIGIALIFIIPIGFFATVGVEGLRQSGRGAGAVGGQMQVMSVVMNIAMAVIVAFVFLATKGYFNALGYQRANVVIYIIIGVQIISALIAAITNTSAGLGGLMQTGGVRALGIVGIIVLVTTLVVLVAMLIFAIFCISFGNLGGGVWKAIGILYLIGLIGIIIGLIVLLASAGFAIGAGPGAGTAGAAVIATVLLVVGFLCYAAGVICHGIGLILGAGRIEREGNPAAVFD